MENGDARNEAAARGIRAMESKIPIKGITDQSGNSEPKLLEYVAARHLKGKMNRQNNTVKKI